MPINISRLIWNAKEMFSVKEKEPTDLRPEYVISKTTQLLKDDIKVYQQAKL